MMPHTNSRKEKGERIWPAVRINMVRSTLAVIVLAALAAPGATLHAQGPKVLIIYDMEGISGVVRPPYERYGTAEYPEGRESLTADVNAAIRGLKAGGAGSIWVEDGHGSGNTAEPDILVGKMDPNATMEFRDRPYDPNSTGIDGSVRAIICIGMHARARTNGFMAHTSTFDVAWNVNGVDLSETHIVALSAARWGIPVIMVSGDNVLKDQLSTDFPDLQYAEVKEAKGHSLAVAVPRPETDRRIESAARQAMQMFLAGKFRPYYLPGPYEFHITFRTGEQARMAANTRGVTSDGELGMRFASPTFIDGYNVTKDVISHGMNYLPLLLRVIRHQPGGDAIVKQWVDLIWQQIDPDSLPAWSLPPATDLDQQKRYYGDQ
jgi:D-amino peptidase